MKVLPIMAVAAVLVSIAATSPAEARQHKFHHRYAASKSVHHERLSSVEDANANKSCKHNTVARQTAYGIAICVDPTYADKFVGFFAALHARGVKVTQITCQAYGHAPGSNHIGGGACDVNQRARNRTIAAMYHAGDLIRAAGLYDGCAFRDCGHVEAMRGLGNYGGTRTYSARSRHRAEPQYAQASTDYMSRIGASQ